MESVHGGRLKSPNDRRASARFPLNLEMRYSILHRRGPMHTGSGRTIDLSSTGLSFTTDQPLTIGQRLNVHIDWPVMLDGSVRLQLVATGAVVRTNGLVAALRIERHDFKTSRVGLKVVS